MTNKEHLYLPAILCITLFFSLYHLPVQNIMEWDESRNAINAFEMYNNGDFLNLYYDGQPDTWNAKPPLFIWLVVLSFQLLGFNEFALRLPSVIATLIFFLYFYKLIRSRTNSMVALLSSMILLGCNSIVARHMGITGDFDALLLCFLTIASYHFLRFAEENRNTSIYYAALFSGLAFYTKGTAAFLYIPGYFLYLLLRGKFFQSLKNKHFWLSILCFLAIAFSWVALVMIFGKSAGQSFYGSSNAIETMLVHDTFRRLTSDNFGQKPNYLFILSTLDAKMNMWHYLFFATTLRGLIVLSTKHKWRIFMKQEHNYLIVFSFCIILPLSIILTLATNKHPWYFAPAFPYVAVVTASGVTYVYNKKKVPAYVVGAFTLFTIFWHFRDLHNIPTDLHYLLGKDSKYFKGTREIVLTHKHSQDIFLYITWSGKEQVYVDNVLRITEHSGQVTILNKKELTEDVLNNLTEVQYFDNYCIALIK